LRRWFEVAARLGLAALVLGAGTLAGLQQESSAQATQNSASRGFTADDATPNAALAATKGSYHALVIGINDYRSLPPLKTAVGDAQAIAEILSKSYGFHVTLLVDATRDQIVGALNAYRRELDASSNLLIYYAGHGYHDKDVDKYYWLPVDAQPNDNTNWIIADDVTSDIKGIPSSHVLVVSDSCYSGAMRDANPSFASGDRARLLEKLMSGHSRDLMASGGDEPVSDSGGSGHSVFAAAMIRGLTAEPDKAFSGDDLFENFVRLQVGGSADQTPDYGPLHNSGHVAGDFIFVRDSSAPIAIATTASPSSPARSPAEPAVSSIGVASRRAAPDIGAAAIKSAILSLDVDGLKRMTADGVRGETFDEAFREFAGDGKLTVAQQFFENTLDSPAAIAWLDDALAAGMDPNLTVSSPYFGHEAILAIAMRAGNTAAAKELLAHGASPHAYEDLFLTSFTAPRFLFPLAGVVNDDHMSIDEKRELTKAFVDAGVVVPEVLPAGEWSSTEMHEASDLRDAFATKLGVKLAPSAACCQAPTPICKNASQRSGTDWCAAVAAMPRGLAFASTPGQDSPFYNLTLAYLLAVVRNDAYFLGRIEFPSKAYGPDYVLVQVSRDASSWTVLKYMSPEAGMGICKKDDKDDEAPEWCWRKISLYRVAGTDQMHDDLFGITWKVVR